MLISLINKYVSIATNLIYLGYLPILLLTGCSTSENRVALVIGNQEYTHQTKLNNTVRDAEIVREALKMANFTIFPEDSSHLEYQNAVDMMTEIKKFNSAAEKADMALFYYSGHAMQRGRINWLLPTNAKILKQSDLNEDNAVMLGNVLLTDQHKENKGRINILILDACRSEGFSKDKLDRGLAEVTPDPESLVAFSTSPGKLAEDNGYYAESFYNIVTQMDGLRVQRVFDLVRQEVGTRTNKKQTPMYYTNISKDVFFIKKRHARFVFSY
ncbi:MAG: caspase family protein [Candidatus Thiodiazotropha weberae]|nr:caspase family protein [Candidatus Thiodiazotropha weberae]